MNNQNNGNRSMMYRYFDCICSPIHLLDILESYTHGRGVQIGVTVMIFADSPDVTVYNEWPELADFEGVGFFCEYEPSPLLITYQDFYDNLKKAVKKHIENKDIEYQQKALTYLETIRKRYQLK